ncbi:unnamed protein product, partial [Discosporangium mesarthrocarpum]
TGIKGLVGDKGPATGRRWCSRSGTGAPESVCGCSHDNEGRVVDEGVPGSGKGPVAEGIWAEKAFPVCRGDEGPGASGWGGHEPGGREWYDCVGDVEETRGFGKGEGGGGSWGPTRGMAAMAGGSGRPAFIFSPSSRAESDCSGAAGDCSGAATSDDNNDNGVVAPMDGSRAAFVLGCDKSPGEQGLIL